MDVNVSDVKFLVGAFVPLDPEAEPRAKKPAPYPFVLDALYPLSPETRPMFGCLAVYIGPKIVLILRDKRDGSADDGVWLATTQDHNESLRLDFPNIRSIQVLGKKNHRLANSPRRCVRLRKRCTPSLRTNPPPRSKNGKIPKPKRRKTIRSG